MKFIMIFGPQAVGKMTVGQELQKVTGFKLFHNHMTIDLLAPIYEFKPEMWRLVNKFRQDIFESVAKSDLDGFIFTYVWAFDLQEDWDYVKKVSEIFESEGAEVYFVELEADLEERVIRNSTPNRLEHKPTKRNVAWSEAEMKETMKNHRLNSNPGEITRENYLRINNKNLSAAEVAKQIKKEFNF
ncbi:AAA family ATPase [Oceanobacillus sp. CAU 1775]